MSEQNKQDFRAKDMAAILVIAGISHGEIAQRAGVEESTVSKALSGRRSKPATVRNFVSLACNLIEERAVNSLASAA